MKRAINHMLNDLFENIIYIDTDYLMLTHSLANREVIYMTQQIKKRMPRIKIIENKPITVKKTRKKKGE